MIGQFQKLSTKLVSTLVTFFLAALVAISSTLYVSRQFEGGAAAINDAGSLRMRSYRLAYLLTHDIYNRLDADVFEREVHNEMTFFEKTLAGLERGDPTRPLFLPKNDGVRGQMEKLHREWNGHIKLLLEEVLKNASPTQRNRLLRDYRPALESFVAMINDLVLGIEQDNARMTSQLRSIQLALVALAVVGTAVLILLMFLLIIRPIAKLQEGIRRMAEGEFAVRVPVESRDEFGDLALGFNHMADHLENLYATLEQRVEAKTHSLEEKNQELALLYEVTAFLNEPASVEEMCRSFLRRLVRQFNAQGGAVRLVDAQSQSLHLVATEGLTDKFFKEETCIGMGECVCGQAAKDEKPVIFDLSRPSSIPLLYNCTREGYRTVSVFTIRVKKRLIGIFNLYYSGKRDFTPQEMRLLETVGQHLGAAIENQQLVSREKEMAVFGERNLLAQELHDSIAQELAFLNIQAQLLEGSLKRGNIPEALESAANIREGVQEGYDDVRELLVHFRTRVHQSDLEGAVRSTLEKFEGQTGIQTVFNVSGSGAPLDPGHETQVLHIVQEALSNVRKHAGAKQVVVDLARAGSYAISVQDDGRGFDPGLDRGDSHVGLNIMRERAHRIGGRLEILSAPGSGATVRFTLDRLQKEI
ncbi:MAG: type IV pili methyl-accepting chemotaxis transducer N-terminal domain-containing protein [Sulfuricellaceae bacterium]